MHYLELLNVMNILLVFCLINLEGLNKDDNENTNELVETNRNLSAAVEKMEIRCKIFEEKIENSKKFKKMIKNSQSLQCLHCSKFISNNIFLQHISNCLNLQPPIHQAASSIFNSLNNFSNLNSTNNLPINSNGSLGASSMIINSNPHVNQNINQHYQAQQQQGPSIQMNMNQGQHHLSNQQQGYFMGQNQLPQQQLSQSQSQQQHQTSHQVQPTQQQMSTYQQQQQQQQQMTSSSNIDVNSLQISINQTMVKESPDAQDSKLYTEYLIQIIYTSIKWSVSRKYKLFTELQRNLAASFPGLKFPDSASVLANCSNMAYINSKRPTVIEERRKGLQRYLRDLAKIEVIRNSSPFKKFLELDQEHGRDHSQSDRNMKLVAHSSNSYRDKDEKRSSDRGIPPTSHRKSHNEDGNEDYITNFVNNNNNNSGNASQQLQSQQLQGQKSSQQALPINRNNNYSDFNQCGIMNSDIEDNLLSKEFSVKIDKRVFTQSPNSFLKSWQEGQIGLNNKENKNPSRYIIILNIILIT